MPLPPSTPPPSFPEPPPYVNVAKYLRSVTPETHWRESSVQRTSRSLVEVVSDQSEDGAEEWTSIVEEWSQAAATDLEALADFVQTNGIRNIEEVIEAIDAAARQNEKSSFAIVSSAQTTRKIAEEMRSQAQTTSLPEYYEQFMAQADKADRQLLRMERQLNSYYPVLRAFRRLIEVLRATRDARLQKMTEAATSELLASIWGADADDL